MRYPNRRICSILCYIILLGASLVFAQDWPQWRGPNRDGKVAGFAAPATWPGQFTQKWKVSVGLGADSTPALVGGKLYVLARQGSDETTLCLDAGSVIMGLTQDGTLWVFNPTDKAYIQVAGVKVADTQTYAHPVLVGNRIFVRDLDSVTLWIID